MEIKVGNGIITVEDNVMPLLGDNILIIYIKLEQGPCQDNICQLIRKVEYEISGHFKYENSFKIAGPPRIELQQGIFDSINKEREKVNIKAAFGKRILIRGLAI
ncbi:MAG: hypothetical protein QXZ44_00820 [Ferroplasma sp.]